MEGTTGTGVTFFLLAGKTVDPIPNSGRLTKVTADEKYAVLETGTALNLLQDLMIRIRDRDAYAKVTDCCGDGYMIGFTMKQGNLSGEGDG